MKRNLFNWGHTLSTTLKTGEFTPILSTVVVPNTTISGTLHFGVTADVPLRPIKWDWYFEAVAFVTPRRILYNEGVYKRFITGAANGKVLPDNHPDSISANFKFPALEVESVLCHMGYQDGIAFNFSQTTDELRAAATIWNWYVRDENVNDEIEIPMTSGEDDPSSWWPNYDKASGMLKVNQFKDYFTSGMTSALKGSPVPVPQFAGSLSLNPTSAPIASGGVTIKTVRSSIQNSFHVYVLPADTKIGMCSFQNVGTLPGDIELVQPSSNVPVSLGNMGRFTISVTGYSDLTLTSGWTLRTFSNGYVGVSASGRMIDDSTGEYVDVYLSQQLAETTNYTVTTGVSYANLAAIRAVPSSQLGTPLVNDLRFAVQHELSKIMDMRQGNRYNEWLENHYGSQAGDNLINIPQFVSACKQRIRFSQVLQTSQSTEEDPLGSFGGFASTGDSLKIHWHCPEESILQVFAFIRPRPGYQQGAARWRTELTRFDRYDTPYGHLGAQAVKGREICVTSDADFNESDFCYQDIFDHLRHIPSRVNGLFRTNKSVWTSQRIFDPANPPAFNEDFLAVSSSDSDRNFSASGVAPWVVDVDCSLYALAPMPKHGTPGLMDHIRI